MKVNMSNKLYYRDKKMWTTLRNLAIAFMLLGIILLTLHLTSFEPDYENLTLGTVEIQSLRRIVGARGTSSYVLESTEGETYRIAARDATSVLRERETTGLQVKIKYFTPNFPSFHYIREMTDGETVLVNYQDDRIRTYTITIVVASLCELLGAGFLWFGTWYQKKSHYTKAKTEELREMARVKK